MSSALNPRRFSLPRAPWLLSWAALLALLGGPAPGLAAPEDDAETACFKAHENGQILRKKGKLRAARAEFVRCSQTSCPSGPSKDCAGWGLELHEAMPTVIFSGQVGGKDVGDVKVSVDGEILAERLDGKAIEMDPGEHLFRFEHKGQVATKKQIIFQAKRNQMVLVSFSGPTTEGPSSGATAPGPSFSTSLSPVGMPPLRIAGYGSAALGVVGLVAGFWFLSDYKTKRQEAQNLRESDTSNTSNDDENMNGKANVSGTLSAVSFVAGGGFLIGGVAMVMYSYGESKRTSRLTIAPALSPHGWSLSAGGAW